MTSNQHGPYLYSCKRLREAAIQRGHLVEILDPLSCYMNINPGAEFDNFRKRTEKEKASMYEIGAREVIDKILPVVDNFERGLAAVPENEKESPFADGMTKIYKQMMTVFEEIGVKPIEAVGQEFNPDYHNAVMHVLKKAVYQT